MSLASPIEMSLRDAVDRTFGVTRFSGQQQRRGGHGVTQFGRVLTELNINISANSPQAKGQVERVFRTLQDRLVKELRPGGRIHDSGGEQPAAV